MSTTASDNEQAVIKTTYGEMRIAFWPDVAPKTVENFQKLAKEADFNDLSYIGRRKKDRAFGRFLHTFKKRKDGRGQD